MERVLMFSAMFHKRVLDLIISSLLLVPTLPLFLIFGTLIKLDSKGPIFFIQKRIGRRGAIFEMYKFRTMVENAEQIGTGLFSYHDDNRITRMGHFLRKTSLDELPQIFNVISGDMSLIGPRPPVTYELGDYKDFKGSLKLRFRMKPGISGLAQTSGRNDLNWDEKIVYDNIYIENFKTLGVLEDIRILFLTIWVIVSMKNTIEKKATEE
ncbi:MAG: sugar transferase [Rhodothermales bacterium]